MKRNFKSILKFTDVLPLFFIIFMLIILLYMVAVAVSTKSDVIVSHNYKGDRILVKKYKPFNKDSVLLSYHKPITHKAKVTGIHNSRRIYVKFENGQEWEARVSPNAFKKYRVGQIVNVHKTFYPKEKSLINYEESVRWRKLSSSK